MVNFKLVNKSIFLKVYEYLCYLCFVVVIFDIFRIGIKDCCMVVFKVIILVLIVLFLILEIYFEK